jgi:hypothetical protein
VYDPQGSWSTPIAIYADDTQIMEFTFNGSTITGRFQKKTTGLTMSLSVGESSVTFTAGNGELSVLPEEELLAKEIVDAVTGAPSSFPVTAARNGSSITLVAKQKGIAFNLPVSLSPLYSGNTDSFANAICTDMSGGTDAGLADYYCNLSDEVTSNTRLIHLESRPVSFGLALSHIVRSLLPIRAKLLQSSGICSISVFASDDLFSWSCVSTGQKWSDSADLTINRIRLNRAAHSWRYYKVCIGGYVPTDADIAPLILEWYATNRRIG